MLNDRPLPRRVNVPVVQTWDKTDVSSSDAAWEAALRGAGQAASDLGRFRGRLRESAATPLKALQTRDRWQALVWRIRWYAAMQVKVDASDQRAAARHGQALELIARVEEGLAYIDPEVLTLDLDSFRAMCAELPALRVYEHYVNTVRMRRDHIQSAEVEAVLASGSDLTSAPSARSPTSLDWRGRSPCMPGVTLDAPPWFVRALFIEHLWTGLH